MFGGADSEGSENVCKERDGDGKETKESEEKNKRRFPRKEIHTDGLEEERHFDGGAGAS